MANKRQRKKRMKKLAQMKQRIQKRIEEAPVVHMTFREIEDMRIQQQTDLHLERENEKLEKTAPYQEALNKKYGGSVMVKDKYINPRASLLHHCSNCHKEWYARPMWLLNKENQKHICGYDPLRMSEGTKKKVRNQQRKLSNDDIVKMLILAEKGMKAPTIAKTLGVDKKTVYTHLKKAEESRVLI
ncbi:HTH domain-containing protein [Bacillus cereus group sp. TH172LC]|uniref:HTH domain-containing protein n=1 Tax=Bacillus cereus group TaxID=86661 RepID=UPI0022DED52F|nr:MULTISPECIES: HTH domain-containing protein [Bacillus cereus group]MDA1631208.1 HTH domain-containing protein [Bacillus cereus group sp. TH172LC]